jgi:hypothetical protein
MGVNIKIMGPRCSSSSRGAALQLVAEEGLRCGGGRRGLRGSGGRGGLRLQWWQAQSEQPPLLGETGGATRQLIG